MSNKYKEDFIKKVNKLLSEGEDYSWMDDNDELPQTEYTPEQEKAIDMFDEYLQKLNEGLISRKNFAQIASELYNNLPEYDYLRNKDAKLPQKYN